MNKNVVLALASFLLAGVSSSALAADISSPPVRSPAVAAPISAYNWTGFYVGANAGWGWVKGKADGCFDDFCASFSKLLDGFVGGGQLGFNYQTGNLVWGAEADTQWTDAKETITGSVFGVQFSQAVRLSHFETIRGRLGVAMGTWLPYVTAGYGWGTAKGTLTVPGVGSANTSDSHGLWVVGAGVEAALAGNWTWKLEYLYLNTGDIDESVTAGGDTLKATAKVSVSTARLGLNYRF
jgi:outer membrane immunogenic protein